MDEVKSYIESFVISQLSALLDSFKTLGPEAISQEQSAFEQSQALSRAREQIKQLREKLESVQKSMNEA